MDLGHGIHRAYPATIITIAEHDFVRLVQPLVNVAYLIGGVRNGSTFLWMDGVEKGEVSELCGMCHG